MKEIFTVDPFVGMNPDKPGEVCNLVKGKWLQSKNFREDIVDPLNGGNFFLSKSPLGGLRAKIYLPI